jgi:hypothetical protein
MKLLLLAVKVVRLFPHVGRDRHAIDGLDTLSGEALQIFGFGHDVVLTAVRPGYMASIRRL